MASNNPFMPTNAPAPGTAPAYNPAPVPTPMPGSSASAAPDSFEVDLTNVQDNFKVPDGLYKVRCQDVEQSVSKGGNPMFVWSFAVVDGQYAGREFKVFTALTPAAMWKVAETVIALGVGQQGQVVKFKRSDVIGKDCGALIEATEYNGQVRSQIARVMSLQEMAEATQTDNAPF